VLRSSLAGQAPPRLVNSLPNASRSPEFSGEQTVATTVLRNTVRFPSAVQPVALPLPDAAPLVGIHEPFVVREAHPAVTDCTGPRYAPSAHFGDQIGLSAHQLGHRRAYSRRGRHQRVSALSIHVGARSLATMSTAPRQQTRVHAVAVYLPGCGAP